MRVNELRNKSIKDLKDMVLERKKELMNLRFQQSSGTLSNTSRVRAARREIAQIKTVLGAQSKL